MTTQPHDDKTIIAGAPSAQPDGAGKAINANALPIGTALGEFEIIDLVGVGGFGIVYLAQDRSLGRRVALKEYMPQSLASRSDGVTVGVRSARHADTFEAGRRSFVNEARLLAQFDHPSLVKVYRFWEANGTAYMVMPYYEGRTLKDALKSMPAPPEQAWLERLLVPLLDALETMHDAQVYHRDIAPDNILLLAGDRPLLLDFGAARHVISDMTQALTVILKPGYAPIEQYAEVPDLKQGAWTDIYALAAVIYFAIAGKTPVPAVGRMVNDSLQPLAQMMAGRYSQAFLKGIDAALAVRPSDRPQSVAELRERLGLPEFAGPSTMPSELPSTPARMANSGARPPPMTLWMGAAAALLGAATLAAIMLLRDEPIATGSTPGSVAGPAASGVAAAASVGVSEAVEATRPYRPLDELDRIFEQRNRDHHVGVTMSRSQVTIGRDRLSFDIGSSKAGYVYVLMVGTDRQHFYLLFPNQVDADNHIGAGGKLELPRKGWSMVAGGPPGTNQFIAIVSEYPRDFKSAGLVKTDPFAEFTPDAAASAAREAGSKGSPFAGRPVCPGGGNDCSAAYGAAVFSIEEVAAPKR